MEVRACQCSFCRKHGTKALADPDGRLLICVRDDAAVNRYTFGLETAEYVVCRTCGCYVAAVTTQSADQRAILVVNVLDDAEQFSSAPVAMSYDHETREQRIMRRQDKWMPVEFVTEF